MSMERMQGEASHRDVGMESEGTRMMEGMMETGRMQQARRQWEGTITQHPTSSVVTCFTLGFGLGLMAGMMMARPAPPRWYERKHAEEVGRQMRDIFERVLPEAISRRMHG